jgi:hypothetical protein
MSGCLIVLGILDIVEGKCEVGFVPNQTLRHKTLRGLGSIDSSLFLNFGRVGHRHSLDRLVLLPGIDSRFSDRPVRNLVTTLNELSPCKCRYNVFSICSSLTRSNLCVGIINQSRVQASDMGLHVPH